MSLAGALNIYYRTPAWLTRPNTQSTSALPRREAASRHGIPFVKRWGMTHPRSNTKSASRRRTNHAATPSRAGAGCKEPDDTLIIPVVEEQLSVGKAQHKTAQVRVRVVPQERIESVDVPLVQEEVDVRRVAVNRVVDAATPVRQEGDVTIVPIFEETLVVEKKLVLREEIHIRRRQSTRRETRKVTVRREEVEIIRSGQSS